ncbi:MAG: isoleucine--tRNA ligase [Phycisphaerae bacterium]|nr:MAG: isoleucine--tRNA ligase [Planctomycetia bacterium]RIK68382.1 MAG: isoleucine--tRNA ligase [Planctomycetota bacterium]GJQ26043.1 MAG: isoleucine--tRNA ligase [Phycisphaerae bacterium]
MFNEVPSQLDFPAMEKRILAFWQANNIYQQSLDARKGCKPFVFFEGPPTANGLPHPGHCLTRAIKDLFPRYKTMTGHWCLRKGGWDTHGLPVEVEVCKDLGIHTKEEIEAYGVEAFNRKCLESVFRYTKEWEELTRRLGFWVNLDEAYVTYHQSYIESVWWSLKQLFDAGLLYQGHKIVWWWAQGGTALSSGEVGQGYREVDDPSVFVRFPLVEDERFRQKLDTWAAAPRASHNEPRASHNEPRASHNEPRASARAADRMGESDSLIDSAPHRQKSAARYSLLVWTTTPWTLPSNMFAAVHKDFDYAIVHDRETGERLIFAAALVESIAKKVKKTDVWQVERTVKGAELVGLSYRPPFDLYRKSAAKPHVAHASPADLLGDYKPELAAGGADYACWRVLHADFVTLESGTGLVHEAPAFGEVDFDLMNQERKRFKNPASIPLLCAVAPNGTFTDEGPEYCRGRWVKECDKDICRDLKERGLLLHQEQYRHDYPFCWRADEDPLIQYPRRSWFIRTTQFRDAMLENNAQIHWLPEHIKEGRFGNFLRDNVDWSLSRERYWGTPLPIWVCETCGHMEAVDSYAALTAKPGVAGLDVWEKAKAAEPSLSDHLKIHKPYIDAVTFPCAKCAHDRQAARAEARGSFENDASSRMRRVPEVIDCWYDSGAMPFAQWGWPHRNHDMFASQFPADFISEALDQTRGWFYSLVAISTMLFGKDGVATLNATADTASARAEARGSLDGSLDGSLGVGSHATAIQPQEYPLPFRTCIVLGLLMGEDGLKMSKSKKNYKEPTYIFDHEGADAMRWLFFSGQTPWTSIRFQESAIAEGQREFLIRLYNCYSFFVIYANIDQWTPSANEPRASARAAPSSGAPSGETRSELDRWILSELAQCSVRVFDAMEAYDNFTAARTLSAFVDALSNWYIRRSRDRYWKSAMDADKHSAYATLYECLVTVAKLIAPFTPFIAEEMYQNLVVAGAKIPGAARAEASGSLPPSSVHLCDYPVTADTREAVRARIDVALNEEIELVRQLVSCGRAARAASKLRVRQPLATMELFHRRAEVVRKYEAVICDELNVKRIEYKDSAAIAEYVTYELKPDFRKIGPKHGPLAPKIKAALAAHQDVDALVRQLEQGGVCKINVAGQDVELTSEEMLVELHAKEGFAAERVPGCGILVLDTHLTPALIDEGMARDLVNQIQQVRKNLNLRYEQHIDLAVLGDADIQRVLAAHGDTIRGETLADSLRDAPLHDVEPARVEIEGHAVEIYVHHL